MRNKVMNYSDDSYYVAWIPPNPEFDERVAVTRDDLDTYAKAQSIADKLNHESKGAMGRYEVRRWVITERA
tara:strand:+ start:708 stop:920 length:213 start_codon:yes stop_codon:yes gene_type:complete